MGGIKGGFGQIGRECWAIPSLGLNIIVYFMVILRHLLKLNEEDYSNNLAILRSLKARPSTSSKEGGVDY